MPEPRTAVARSPLGTVTSYLRNAWRTLTAMRTALILLFLLAVAAVPGALLPQRSLNEGNVNEYIAENGWLGELYDRLQLFDVFSSWWFTAIYVLLFISLVGCLTPRMIEHFQSLRAKPVAAPRNLSRMPRHITETVDGEPAGGWTPQEILAIERALGAYTAGVAEQAFADGSGARIKPAEA